MVFFTCNACGESMKKANVEKHYLTKCRACEVLSCIDCGKDFHGDSYKEHTSCISEDQKYGGKNFKATLQKGVVKQSSWMEIVREASLNPSLKPAVRDAMKRIVDAGYDNIPRKKAKFVNFLGNSLRIRGDWLVNEIWNVIDSHAAALKQASKAQASSADDGKQETSPEPEPSPKPEAVIANEKSKTKKKKKGEKVVSEGEAGNENGITGEGRRKRKRQGDPIEAPVVALHGQEDEQPRKKKKKKKREAEEGKDNQEVESSEVTDQASKTSGKRKGKKKKRKLGDEDEGSRLFSPETGDDRLSARADEETQGVENGDVSMNEDGQHQALKTKFPWEAVITEVLEKAGGEMRLKKLKKKVLTEFMSRGGDPSLSTEDKVMAKFNKKVLKNPRLKVYKEIVHLKS